LFFVPSLFIHLPPRFGRNTRKMFAEIGVIRGPLFVIHEFRE
jgi:hypothetical protein